MPNTRREQTVKQLAQLVDARLRCIRDGSSVDGNSVWIPRHTDSIEQMMKDVFPSGSGVDSGTTIDLDASTPDRLVFHMPFHHMDEYGSYDGWTEHIVTVTPSLAFGYHIRIGGKNRNDIKEYLHELIDHVLSSDVEWTHDTETDKTSFRLVSDIPLVTCD